MLGSALILIPRSFPVYSELSFRPFFLSSLVGVVEKYRKVNCSVLVFKEMIMCLLSPGTLCSLCDIMNAVSGLLRLLLLFCCCRVQYNPRD